MKIVIDIPDSDVPKKQEVISVNLHFIDGKVCGCTYPFEELATPKMGRWMNTGQCEEWYTYVLECSLCGGEIMWGGKFCPSCGAIMSKEEEE